MSKYSRVSNSKFPASISNLPFFKRRQFRHFPHIYYLLMISLQILGLLLVICIGLLINMLKNRIYLSVSFQISCRHKSFKFGVNNLDLLKLQYNAHSCHSWTSYSFLPLIRLPIWLSITCDTLINNIFTKR